MALTAEVVFRTFRPEFFIGPSWTQKKTCRTSLELSNGARFVKIRTKLPELEINSGLPSLESLRISRERRMLSEVDEVDGRLRIKSWLMLTGRLVKLEAELRRPMTGELRPVT